MRKRMLKSIIYSGLITLIVLSSMFTALAVETFTWEEKASMSVGRYNFGNAIIDGNIYAIGGSTTDTGYSKNVEMYNIISNSWESKANMINGRYAFGATACDGKIYVFGGKGEGSINLSSVEMYDPATNTWITKTDMPRSRYQCEAVTVGTKIYVFGGSLGTEYFKQVDVYDTQTDTWETKTPMQNGRVGFGITTLDSKIYLLGGQNSDDSGMLTPVKSVDVYNTTLDTWETSLDMPYIAASNFEAVSQNNHIYIFPRISSTSQNEVCVFDLNNNNWSIIPLSQHYSSYIYRMSLINNSLYVYGGYLYNSDGSSTLHANKLISIIISEAQSPTNLTATPGNTQIALNWDTVEGAETYTIKKSTTQGGPYITIAENVTDANYLDTSVVNGITYYYVVTAVNQAGESDPSNEASAAPIAPIVNRAILNITMQNSLIKEYDMSMTEVDNFISWYNSSGSDMYTINKSYNIRPFLSRKVYIVKDMIVCFEVMEYIE